MKVRCKMSVFKETKNEYHYKQTEEDGRPILDHEDKNASLIGLLFLRKSKLPADLPQNIVVTVSTEDELTQQTPGADELHPAERGRVEESQAFPDREILGQVPTDTTAEPVEPGSDERVREGSELRRPSGQSPAGERERQRR